MPSTADGGSTEAVSEEACDQNHLRVMEMQLIGDLEQQLKTAEFLLDGLFNQSCCMQMCGCILHDKCMINVYHSSQCQNHDY